MKLDFVNDNENAMAVALNGATASAQKKPVTVQVFHLEQDTEFVTSSGSQLGKEGDVCIIGKDHAWPVTQEYFDENYAIVDDYIDGDRNAQD